jgi:hypothetical protein
MRHNREYDANRKNEQSCPVLPWRTMLASVAMKTWNSSAGHNRFRALAVAITDGEPRPDV